MRNIEKVNAEIEEVKKELENVHGTGTEVYARIVGYYRSVRNWNKGKREEYNHRLMFSSENERIGKTLSDCDCLPISGSLNFSSSENLSEKKRTNSLMLAGLQKTTLVNFPRRVAAAVFLPGCNMRCPYCHNAELALASPSSFTANQENTNDYYELSEIYTFLESRKNLISGFVISGGEPFMSPALFELIERAKSLNLAVKIDTNGLFPERIEEVLGSSNLKPDMIAIDVKTSPERYGELLASKTDSAAKKAKTALLKTLDILKSNTEKTEVEYRTVLAPYLVSEDEINKIASLLPKNARWRLAQFVPGTCLNPEWNSVEPYPLSQAQALTAIAKSLITDTELR